MEPFKVHVAEEMLDDLRARLRRTRWPDEVPGIGWKQGTNLDWLQHLVSYWMNEFDWRAWEQRLAALDHFMSARGGTRVHEVDALRCLRLGIRGMGRAAMTLGPE